MGVGVFLFYENFLGGKWWWLRLRRYWIILFVLHLTFTWLVGGWLMHKKSIFRFYDIVPLLFYFLFGLFCFTLIKSNLLDLRVFWKKQKEFWIEWNGGHLVSYKEYILGKVVINSISWSSAFHWRQLSFWSSFNLRSMFA